MRMRSIILILGLFMPGLLWAQNKFTASNWYFQQWYGTETIEFEIDYNESGKVTFTNPPSWHEVTEFTIVYDSGQTVVAVSSDRKAMIEINLEPKKLMAGDVRTDIGAEQLSMGKRLESSILRIRPSSQPEAL